MVIHAKDTSAALAAVVGPWRLDALALVAAREEFALNILELIVG